MKADRLLRIPEVAARLNCDRRNVYYLIEFGHLPALSIGRNGRGLRVRESHLNAFVEKKLKTHQEKTGFCEY